MKLRQPALAGCTTSLMAIKSMLAHWAHTMQTYPHEFLCGHITTWKINPLIFMVAQLSAAALLPDFPCCHMQRKLQYLAAPFSTLTFGCPREHQKHVDMGYRWSLWGNTNVK